MRGIHGLLTEGRAYVPAAQSGQGRYSGALLCGAAMIFVVALAGLLPGGSGSCTGTRSGVVRPGAALPFEL